jgi:alpha-1,6-mannosyltransferase
MTSDWWAAWPSQTSPRKGRTRQLSGLFKKSEPTRADVGLAKLKARRRKRSAALVLAASTDIAERQRVRRLFSAERENLVRLDPPETAAERPSFHLIDTTMMYAPRSGGVKRYLTAKGAWLAKRRPDIHRTLVVPGASTRVQADGLVTVAAARLPFGDGYRMPASLTKWESVLLSLRPDIIEAGDVFVPGHAALEAGQALGAPVVGFCHTDAAALAALHLGDWAEQPTFDFWARAYQRFDHVVAPSKHTAARLAEAGVTRVMVQPLGVDTELFNPSRGDRGKLLKRLELPAETRLICFAGRPAREKNIDAMIAAVEKLGDPYRLLLIGAGHGARYSPQVVSVDYEREPQRLAALIASCDAFLHANENEIFGLVVLEAMAAGLPVIGPNKGGVGELLDNEVGQLTETADAAGLAEAIEALFARDVAAISKVARDRAVRRHSWDATFEGLTRLYADLLARAPTTRAPLALSA